MDPFSSVLRHNRRDMSGGKSYGAFSSPFHYPTGEKQSAAPRRGFVRLDSMEGAVPGNSAAADFQEERERRGAAGSRSGPDPGRRKASTWFGGQQGLQRPFQTPLNLTTGQWEVWPVAAAAAAPGSWSGERAASFVARHPQPQPQQLPDVCQFFGSMVLDTIGSLSSHIMSNLNPYARSFTPKRLNPMAKEFLPRSDCFSLCGHHPERLASPGSESAYSSEDSELSPPVSRQPFPGANYAGPAGENSGEKCQTPWEETTLLQRNCQISETARTMETLVEPKVDRVASPETVRSDPKERKESPKVKQPRLESESSVEGLEIAFESGSEDGEDDEILEEEEDSEDEDDLGVAFEVGQDKSGDSKLLNLSGASSDGSMVEFDSNVSVPPFACTSRPVSVGSSAWDNRKASPETKKEVKSFLCLDGDSSSDEDTTEDEDDDSDWDEVDDDDKASGVCFQDDFDDEFLNQGLMCPMTRQPKKAPSSAPTAKAADPLLSNKFYIEEDSDGDEADGIAEAQREATRQLELRLKGANERWASFYGCGDDCDSGDAATLTVTFSSPMLTRCISEDPAEADALRQARTSDLAKRRADKMRMEMMLKPIFDPGYRERVYKKLYKSSTNGEEMHTE